MTPTEERLRKALQLIWDMLEDGRLVRDIRRDGDPDWAMKMLKFTSDLHEIQAALSLPAAPAETDEAQTIATLKADVAFMREALKQARIEIRRGHKGLAAATIDAALAEIDRPAEQQPASDEKENG